MAKTNPTVIVNPHADDIYEALGLVSTARAALAETEASETTDDIESILDTVIKKLEVFREVVNLTRLCRQENAGPAEGPFHHRHGALTSMRAAACVENLRTVVGKRHVSS